MPDPPAGRVVVPDLDHQLGPQRHPLEVAAAGPAARLGAAALAGLQRRQHRAHRSFGLGAEAGDVADAAQLAAVVEAEDQRADRALGFPRPPAHHHAVDRPLALDLRHPLALAREVGRVELLRHHPLDAAQPALGLLGVAGQRRQLEPGRRGDRLQPPPALAQRRLEQRLVALGEQVEGDVLRRDLRRQPVDSRLRRVDPFLQQVELEVAIGVADHQLAVEHPAPRREAQLGKVAPQLLAAPRLDVEVLAVDEDDRAEAVELRLKGPLLAARQLFAGQRQLRLDRRREGQAHGAQATRRRCGAAAAGQPAVPAASRRLRLSRGSGIGTAASSVLV